RSRADKLDNQLEKRVGPIERQKMAAACDGLHHDAGNARTRALALRRSRPIPVTIDEQNRDTDAAILFLCQLPAFGVAQEADKGAVMHRAVSDAIEFRDHRRRDAVRSGYAAAQN